VIRALLRWLVSGRAPDAVSEDWSRDHLRAELRVGWEGPRWRTPKERAQMQRRDRRLRVVNGSER
jgi:hypothetical protein